MPPLTYISAFRRTDANGGSRGEAMPERENAKIVNAEQKVARKSAFGEPTHARPIASELAWRSLNRGLGHSKDLITLSLRYSPTIAYTLLSCAGTRVKCSANREQSGACSSYAEAQPALARQGKYGFLCIRATDGAAREEPSSLVLFRVATEVEHSSREAA